MRRSPRRPLLSLVSAAAVVVAGLSVSVLTAPPASAAVTDLRINEVESNGGTPVDWVELVNTGATPVDASGLRIKDDDDTRTFAVPAGTVVPAGGFVAVDVDVSGGFGLGAADVARLFQTDGTTLIDSYSWTVHAATTYGRCPDGTGGFRTMSTSTKAAANDCSSPLRIHEIESSGGTGVLDWVEIVNTGAEPVDASGLRIKDSDDTRTLAVPPGTTIAPGAFYALDVDIAEAQGGFGLGSNDSARLFATDGVTLIDSYSWTTHATTTYGRCPNPAGAFTTTTSPTRGAANDCGFSVPPGLRFNEVESNNDPVGDYAELVNTGVTPIDISGYLFNDNDATRAPYVVPAGTTIAPGGYFVLAEAAFGFGLGAADAVRLLLPDAVTPVDSYSWTVHATTTYGRCPDGTGAFTTTTSSTRAARNDCVSPVRLNEVESDGGTPGDWVELVNPSAAPADASGLVVKDDDDTHAVTVPAGTTIAAGGLYVVDTEPAFGLGGADTARLFAPGGTTLLDSYAWTAHAATTYARCPNPQGAFTTSASSTRAAANDCGITVPAGVKVNEVESNGDLVGDFAEIVNTGSTPVDISGYRFRDNDVSHVQYPVPAGTTLAPGGYFVFAEADFGFGLGGADSVTVWLPDGTTVVDTYAWTAHAATTYGRCPDGTGAFTTTTSSTRAAANDCSSPVRVNEVESNGGTPGDWVELINNGATPADVSGFRVKDSGEPGYTIPAATTIPAGGYLVIEEAQLGSGLGGADSARLFAADGTTLLDSYTWTAHATTTYGRCPNGSGAFATTQVVTKGAANNCPGDLVVGPWPGGPEVTTVDPAGTFASNLSGLMYEPSGSTDPGTLWASRNGPGALFKLLASGQGYAPAGGDWAAGKLLRYADGTGDVDAEGLTFTSAGPGGGIFVASERNNAASGVSRPAILRYDPETPGTQLLPTNDWNLSADLPGLGANLGLEAIAWVPDSYLTARGLVDVNTAAPYSPASYPGHGSGLFLVGVEQTGMVYAYALDQTSNAFTRVASFASGFPGVMELYFEAETQKLWVVCDDTCQGRSARFDVTAGAFRAVEYYERPTGMPNLNNEGFTLAPRAECVAGRKPSFYADDSSTGGFALRRGTVSCTPLGAQTVTFTSTPPAAPTVGQSYVVAATGGASGNPVVFATSTRAVCTVTGSTVRFEHPGTCTVRADQAGSADFAPGAALQDVVVGRASQPVTFTSTPPGAPVVGQSYVVAATGGASGNPVTFAETSGACTLAGATLTYVAPGACTVVASQAGNTDLLPGTASQTSTAAKAATTLGVVVLPDTLRANVAVTAPGAAPLTGDVSFLVDGVAVGSASLTGGVATLARTVPTGAERSVQAVYGGSALLDGSSGTVVRRDPTITAAVTSPEPPSASGWYAGPVTVTFTCTPQGAPLVGDCPAPVVLAASGEAQSATGTVSAADGGRSTVLVAGLDLDLDDPAVRVAGVDAGATYRLDAPTPRCVGSDPTSAVARCTLSTTRDGLVVTVRATAVDLAGNTATDSVRYRLPVVRVVDALRYVDGRYVVERGTTYRLQALLAAAPVPSVLGPVRDDERAPRTGPDMRRADREAGLTSWIRPIAVDERGSLWKVVVEVGGRRIVVPIKVIA